MNLLYLMAIFGLSVMSATKNDDPQHIRKKIMQTNTDALFYNMLLFASAALIAVPLMLADKQTLSFSTFLFGAAFGILSIIFQLSYSNAFKTGPISLTVLINNFSLIIPVLFGLVYYKEPITANRVIGIILLFISFFLSIKKDEKLGKVNIRWLLFTLICFASGGFCSAILQMHQHTETYEERNGFILVAYSIAFVFSLFIYFYKYKVHREKITFKLTPKVLIPAIIAGTILGLFQRFSLTLIALVDSAIIFPILRCTITILMTIFGVIFFKDKLKKIQLAGIAVGLVSIALISI